jgi:phage recombination protein Bet
VSTALVTLSTKLASRFGMEQNSELVETLKATAFRSKEPVSDAQMTALLVIANEYGLNPFTKEIYAYPDQYKGIVPVVGVDGWIRIINEHPQFDGMEFDFDPEFVTCRIYRKDRSHSTEISEYLAECRRGTDPWKNMPRRMLRHKALIQCARVAFGFALYDDEEGPTAAGITIDAATGEIIQPAIAPRGPQRKSTVVAPAAPPPGAGGITGNQLAYLRKKLQAAGIAEQAICDRFQAAGIEHLTADQFDEIKGELLTMA